MKTISHIDQQFNELGRRVKTIIHYEDGTKRTHYPTDKRTKEETREFMFYTIKRFNLRHQK